MTLFSGPITGRKAFAIFASFFVVIIAVNLVLAWKAISTFPGLEVGNSYVASQSFDADRAVQEALGWDVAARVDRGMLRLTILGRDGRPAEVADLTAVFGRATSVRDDQNPAFVFDGTAFVAPVVTAPGNWNLRLRAHAADGSLFQQRVVVLVDHADD